MSEHEQAQTTPGGTDLTVGLLRAELRAARAEDRRDLLVELDTRFKPITDYLAGLDGGRFSEGMKAGIVAVIAADHAADIVAKQNSKEKTWSLRSSKAALISLAVFILVSIFNVAVAVASLTHSG